jgi:hypothetical protein
MKPKITVNPINKGFISSDGFYKWLPDPKDCYLEVNTITLELLLKQLNFCRSHYSTAPDVIDVIDACLKLIQTRINNPAPNENELNSKIPNPAQRKLKKR